jgi:tetratricopeptide (TPR) repeat protein
MGSVVFGWILRNKDDVPKKHRILSRKEASEEYVKYGEDMANSNNLEKAFEYFDKAIEIYPNNDCAWGDKGLIFDKQGKVEEALSSFSKALTINPKNAITWHNKGLALIKSNRLSEAIACFDNAIDNNADYAKAWYNKGRALSLLSQLTESQVCFDKARKLDPLLYSKLKRMR